MYDPTTVIRNWNDALISTGEALQQILCSEHPIGQRLEAIATITLNLLEQERKEAEALEEELAKKYDGCPNDYRPNS